MLVPFRVAPRLALIALALSVALVSTASAEQLKLMIIDQQAVLRNSLAGQDIARQAKVLQAQIQKEIQDEQNAILKQESDLKAHAQVYSPAQRQLKLRALDARQRAYPQFEQRENQILQASLQNASEKVGDVLRPILKQMMKEHDANLLLDRSAVMYAAPGFDFTQEALNRLNAKLKTVKLVRANLDQAPRADKPEPTSLPAGNNNVQLPQAGSARATAPALKLPAEANN